MCPTRASSGLAVARNDGSACLHDRVARATAIRVAAGRTHARVRARVAELNRSVWARPTLEALIERYAPASAALARVDELALALATKLVETPWKVTEKDAAEFRDAGLDDTVYLDVLDTTAIQNALDRLCWALGVPADVQPLLPTSDPEVS